ncbi:hypothetical protein [Microcoleus sp. OTE_8_concoct_300]|uniref:hypothetical protein n=1 Tax=Microcoleus sp. OTE_8_concoct_300 TaxID=2964710 RepID=UPI00403F08F8
MTILLPAIISIPECTDFDANFGCGLTINCCWGKLYVTTEILHHSQLAFYEQACWPVPQKINFLVEQASKPVADVQDVSYQDLMAIDGRSTRHARTNSFNIKKQ